jgi:hypothetical protein
VENRWRDAARAAGKRADLEDIRAIDPDLVERESLLLASVLRQVVEGLPEGGRALVVGHSPTNEAAVLGLAGRVVPPLGKGKGVLLVEDGGDYRVEPPRTTGAANGGSGMQAAATLGKRSVHADGLQHRHPVVRSRTVPHGRRPDPGGAGSSWCAHSSGRISALARCSSCSCDQDAMCQRSARPMGLPGRCRRGSCR